MECPKCGLEIDDKATVCPNCKKVLKIVCPKCKTINTSNTCKRCGYVILTKCHKCGKINLTANGKCKKCGFDLEKSVVLNESNTDDFGCLVISFPSMGEISQILGNARLFNKFKQNIDSLIDKQAKECNLRRQIIGKDTVIRFNKDYSFKSSCRNAIETAVKILTEISKINFRMTNKKNMTFRCNMFIIKRTIEDSSSNMETGLSINLVNNNNQTKKDRVYGSFQLLCDNFVQESLGNEYVFDPLSSTSVNGEMRTFFEINILDKINLNEKDFEEEDEEADIPNFVQNLLIEQDKLDGEALSKMERPVDPDAIYDIETIDFSEIKCEFIRTENIDVFYHLTSKLQSTPKGILAIKANPLYLPYSTKVLSAVSELGLYSNVVTVTCYDDMKYTPYSFFRDLVSAIFEYTVSQKLFNNNDFSMFASIDSQGMIKDLITMSKRDDNPQDTRYVYFDIFLTLLQVIPNTLIYIENFDKMDESSYQVLKYLFRSFEKLDVSYLVQYSADYSLHKDSHFLLSKPYYTEITLKPTPFEKIVEDNKDYYKEVMDSFYFRRIAKYSFGSILFLDFSIQYLIESGVFEEGEKCLKLVNPETIIIPSSLNKLIKRRINILKDDPQALKFLATTILLGTRIDEQTITSLGFENQGEIIDKLCDTGYVYYYNNCLYFPNYNLLKENLLEVLDQTLITEISNLLFDRVFVPDNPCPAKAYLYRVTKDYRSEFLEWEKLAKINLSLGDFNSYLNCAGKILELLDMDKNPESQEDIEAYKLELYSNIANNMFDFVPEKTFEIAEKTLAHLAKTTDTEKVISLCNKLIQGCLIIGNYAHALELTHRVLSLLPNSSLDPAATNFNKDFFLMTVVHIEILFNTGNWEDCLEVGYNVLNIVNQENLDVMKPDYLTVDQFRTIIFDTIGYVALANVFQLKGNVKDFLNIVRSDFTAIPHAYDAFIALEDFIAGREPQYDNSFLTNDNKFSAIIYHVLEAFKRCTHDYNIFAGEIYEAKILAKEFNLYQIGLFLDAMIGYAYFKLYSFRKASAIYYHIIKTANEKGLEKLLYLVWLLMSFLNIEEGKYIISKGILSNALIQMEKEDDTNPYLHLWYKYTLYRVLRFRQEGQGAKIYLAQSNYLATKYGVTFEFDTDPSHFIPLDDPDDDSNIVTQESINLLHDENAPYGATVKEPDPETDQGGTTSLFDHIDIVEEKEN